MSTELAHTTHHSEPVFVIGILNQLRPDAGPLYISFSIVLAQNRSRSSPHHGHIESGIADEAHDRHCDEHRQRKRVDQIGSMNAFGSSPGTFWLMSALSCRTDLPCSPLKSFAS
jgi:hypothetical protein